MQLISDKQWALLKVKLHLGDREAQVAQLACMGVPNKEIADWLKIKTGTVKTHKRTVFRLLRVSSSMKLLYKCLEAIETIKETKK